MRAFAINYESRKTKLLLLLLLLPFVVHNNIALGPKQVVYIKRWLCTQTPGESCLVYAEASDLLFSFFFFFFFFDYAFLMLLYTYFL